MRQKLIEIDREISDAGTNTYRGWDNTKTNLSIKFMIEEVYSNYVSTVQSFGLLLVIRHGLCASHSHTKDYYIENSYGLDLPYPYPDNFIWDDVLDQGPRFLTCPCDENNRPEKHTVLYDVVFRKNSDLSNCKILSDILDCIYNAKTRADSNRPRAAIREYLLRAVLKINDMVLPVPMEQYIERLK